MTVNRGLGGNTTALNGMPNSHNHQNDSETLANTQSADVSGTTHPLGLLPLGNQFLSEAPKARSFAGTFQFLPDEMLSVILECLDHESLRTLGYTCKFLFAFCHANELWKSCFLE